MLGNKTWTISILNSIMEANHLSKWTIRTLPRQVTEMVQAHSVSTQVVLEAIELVLQMEWHKIIRRIYSIWLIKEKLQMEVRTTINKWWWQPNSSSTPHKTIIKCSQAWIHLVRTPIKEINRSIKPLPKPSLESKDRTVVQATQFNNNMKTPCQYRAMVIIKTWMPLSILIITERDLSKVVQAILQITMLWTLLWILVPLLKEMVIAMLQVETTQP